MQKTLKQMNESKNQFVDNSDYVDGTFGYGMTLNAIKYINENKTSKALEVWGGFVKVWSGYVAVWGGTREQNPSLALGWTLQSGVAFWSTPTQTVSYSFNPRLTCIEFCRNRAISRFKNTEYQEIDMCTDTPD